jgi:hypothetical protein
VTGGDDTFPDEKVPADVIAVQCTSHFGGTYGVMQPTGDRFAGGSIDRIAGSPWMGRKWAERAHRGAGPLHPDFYHMFVDEALRGAAIAQGVYWERRDLVHLHMHFMRESAVLDAPAVHRPIPIHLVAVNSRGHWEQASQLFARVARGRFAECLPA